MDLLLHLLEANVMLNSERFTKNFSAIAEYLNDKEAKPPVKIDFDSLMKERKTKTCVSTDRADYSWSEDIPKDVGPLIRSDGETMTILNELKHTAVYGATGMGKSRSYLIPSIIASAKSGHNMVIGDCKGELHETTSGYLRSKGYDVRVLNFADTCRSNCFSLFKEPFNLIKSNDPNNIAFGKTLILDIAKIICPIQTERDPNWESTAASMINALIFIDIMRSDSYEEITLNHLLELKTELLDNAEAIEKYSKMVKDYPDIVADLDTFNMSAKTTQSCYVSFLNQALVKYSFNPYLQTLLSKDEINPEILLEDKKAIFIIFPEESRIFDSLTSTIVKIIYETLIRKSREYPRKRLPHRVHMLLDEFAHMPLVDFTSTISTARSRNIMFTLVIQSYAQLVDRFGGPTAEDILNNCTVWVFLGGSDERMMEKIMRFGKDLDIDRLTYLDRRAGEAVIREVNKPSYVTKLVDLSRYEGIDQKPLDLPTTPAFGQYRKDSAAKAEETVCLTTLDNGERVMADKFFITLTSLQVLHNFPNVNEMREHLVANKHVEGVSQKEISSILKWIGYDPKPEFDALRRHLENRLLYSESKAGAVTDFLVAFAIMDPEYRMLNPLLCHIREWKRLCDVMVSEGWTEEEACRMRKALMDMRGTRPTAEFPEEYIGACMTDRNFERKMEKAFMEKYGKVPNYSTKHLRNLVYAMQLDYDFPAFMQFLCKFLEKHVIDMASREAALSFVPKEKVDELSVEMMFSFGFKTSD